MKKYFVAMVGLATLVVMGCGGHHDHKHNHHEPVNEEHHDEHVHSSGHEADKHEYSQAHADEIMMSDEQMEAASVSVDIMKAGSFRAVLKVSGKVCRQQGAELTVVAPTDGVVSFSVGSMTEGSAVERGKTLAWLSGAKLQQGDAARQAKLVFETTRKEFERAQRLVADKIISVKEYEQVALRYETAKAACQGVDLTGRGTMVQSSMAGYVKQLLVRQGDYVSMGQPMLVVAHNRRLQLEADVPVRYFKYLREVTGANFRMASDDTLYRLADMNGRVVSYGKAAEGGAAYVPLTLEFDNIGDVVSGIFAEVYLLMRQRDDVLSVPLKAVMEEQGFNYVYLQAHDGTFKRKQVITGQSDGNRVEICGGLSEGDKVVTRGAYQVKMASVAKVVPGHSHHH